MDRPSFVQSRERKRCICPYCQTVDTTSIEAETVAPQHYGHALDDVGDTPVDNIVLTPPGKRIFEHQNGLFRESHCQTLFS
jgi:hypothetical protein